MPNSYNMSNKIEKIMIYSHKGQYFDLDINNISYDSISKEEVIKAIKVYPNSIYCSNGNTSH